MNIIFLYNDCFSSTGGIQKFNLNFIKALGQIANDQDWKVTCLSLNDKATDFPDSSLASFRTASSNKFYFVLEAFALIRHADIIFVGHLYLSFPLMVFSKISSLVKKNKIVLIAHGIEVWDIQSGFHKKLIGAFDYIFAVSQFTRDKIAAYSVGTKKILLFPNTVEVPMLQPGFYIDPDLLRTRFNIKKEDKVMLTLCRIAGTEKKKGYDQVIKAMATMGPAFKDFKYILAGNIQEPEGTRLLQLIHQLGLQQRVILPGFIPENELDALFQLCDLFIMPSKKEGFGIVFLEALIRGKPVLAGNEDGSSEALMDGQLGMLIDPEDIGGIGHAIASFYNKTWPPHLYDAENIRKKVTDRFGFDGFKDQLQSFIFQNV